MRQGLALACAITLLVATACATASSPPASRGAPVTPPPPSVAVGQAGVLCAREQAGCKIAAGTYSTRPFVHPFTFTIPEPWTNQRAWPHGGEVGPPAGGMVLQWATDVRANRSQDTITSAEDLVAALGRLPGFTVSEPVPTTVGGAAGIQFDVETATALDAYLAIPEDQLNIEPAEKLRFFAVERDGALVILILDAFQQSAFDGWIAAAQPVIESITWE